MAMVKVFMSERSRGGETWLGCDCRYSEHLPGQQTKIPIMKRRFPFGRLACALTLLAVAGCSTPASRISRNAAAFAEWPAAVQEKVRAGQIDLGFTPEQVRTALGQPDRVTTRTTNDGTSEVWAYRSRAPRFSVGVGVGTSHGSTGIGGGVGVGTGGERSDDAMRVVFAGGKVSAIETAAK
jgi:hypothetical protein